MTVRNLIRELRRPRKRTLNDRRRVDVGFEHLEPRMMLSGATPSAAAVVQALGTTAACPEELTAPDDPRGGVYLMVGVKNSTSQTAATDGELQDDSGPLTGPQLWADERPIIEYILGSTDDFETESGRGDSEPVQENSGGPVVVLKSRGSGNGEVDARGADLSAVVNARDRTVSGWNRWKPGRAGRTSAMVFSAGPRSPGYTENRRPGPARLSETDSDSLYPQGFFWLR